MAFILASLLANLHSQLIPCEAPWVYRPITSQDHPDEHVHQFAGLRNFGGRASLAAETISNVPCVLSGIPYDESEVDDTVDMVRAVAERRVELAPPGFAVGGPKTLAALRMASGVAGLISAIGLWSFVIPPEPLRVPPPGSAWLGFLPVDQSVYDLAVVLLAVASIAVALGWHPRRAAWIAIAAFFYAGWATTLTGKVDHGHHIFWALLIVAVSPSANAWAVRRENRPGSFQWPITAMMTIIGMIYFSAGLQKLATSGVEWGYSENLANTMYNLAWEKGLQTKDWLVGWPSRILGTGALLFELLFFPLVVHPRTRKVWPVGLVFHWGTWWILGISFLTLQLLYVVFLPLDRPDNSPHVKGQWMIPVLVTAVAVTAVAGEEEAWPVAAYPGFDVIQDHHLRILEVDGVLLDADSAHARQLRTWRLAVLIRKNIEGGRGILLAEWLGADRVDLVMVNTATGEVVERTSIYP